MRRGLLDVQSQHTHKEARRTSGSFWLLNCAVSAVIMTTATGIDNILLAFYVGFFTERMSLSAGTNHRSVKCRQLESTCTNELLVLSINLLGSRGLQSAIMSFVSAAPLKLGILGFVTPLK